MLLSKERSKERIESIWSAPLTKIRLLVETCLRARPSSVPSAVWHFGCCCCCDASRCSALRQVGRAFFIFYYLFEFLYKKLNQIGILLFLAATTLDYVFPSFDSFWFIDKYIFFFKNSKFIIKSRERGTCLVANNDSCEPWTSAIFSCACVCVCVGWAWFSRLLTTFVPLGVCVSV